MIVAALLSSGRRYDERAWRLIRCEVRVRRVTMVEDISRGFLNRAHSQLLVLHSFFALLPNRLLDVHFHVAQILQLSVHVMLFRMPRLNMPLLADDWIQSCVVSRMLVACGYGLLVLEDATSCSQRAYSRHGLIVRRPKHSAGYSLVLLARDHICRYAQLVFAMLFTVGYAHRRARAYCRLINGRIRLSVGVSRERIRGAHASTHIPITA